MPPGWGEEWDAKGSPGYSSGRGAIEEAVVREVSATASLLDLGGHTLRMLVPALLVLSFCLRGRAGTARSGGGGKEGGGLCAGCRFTEENGAKGSYSWV